MPQVHRLTDPNTAGAPIVEVVQQTVYANNLLVSVDGSPVEGHGPGVHSGPLTANGSQNVFIQFIPVNKLGDPDTCGHPRADGSPNVYVNDPSIMIGVTPTSDIIVVPSRLFTRPDTPIARDDQPYIRTSPPPTRQQNEQAGTAPNNPGVTESPPIEDQPETKCDENKPNVLGFLSQCLQESKTGAWRETGQAGKPSNQNILNMWKNIGLGFNSDQVPWCAGFACFAMKQSGMKWIREAGAANLANKLGSGSVDPNYKTIAVSEMKPGDLVLWGSGHVNFCYSANGGKYTFVGGNQSPGKGADPPVKDPQNDGDVTISWPSGWTPGRGGITKVVRLDC
jgi:uncharacterized Zn-binding protein involved in type VI secretion